MKSTSHNIAFMKLCCIGDIIFMIPLIKIVRHNFPNAKLFIITSKWVKDIVERIPEIDEIIYFDTVQKKQSVFKTILETLRFSLTLRSKKIDSIIFGHRTSMFPLIAFCSGIKNRIGFEGTKYLTASVKFDSAIHETLRYTNLIYTFKKQPTHQRIAIVEKKSDLDFAQKYFSEFKNTQKLIGVFPGGGDNPGTLMTIKRWYPERYAELCSLIWKNLQCIPVFLGTESDKIVIEDIITNLDKDVKYINSVGSNSLGQLCGILKRCSLFIGGDSGPLHMAAALGVSTIGIFGPSDPRLVAPIGENHRYIWKKIECAPCYTPESVLNKKNFDGKKFLCNTKTHACIKGISVDEVFRNVTEMINK